MLSRLKIWLGVVDRRLYDADTKRLNEAAFKLEVEITGLKKENAELKDRLQKAEQLLPKPGQWSLEAFMGSIIGRS